jgi:hypothetical protein
MREVLLACPERVAGLPLHPDADRAAVADDLAQVVGRPAHDVRRALEDSATELRNEGLRLLGSFVVAGSDGSDGSAMVAAALRELAAPDVVDDLFADRAADALRNDMAEHRPYADTRRIELPAGPAVASLVFGQYDLPPGETGAEETITIPTFRAEFLIPTPEWDGVVVLDVSTTDEAAWPEVSVEAVRIARSVRFVGSDDVTPPADGERLLRL